MASAFLHLHGDLTDFTSAPRTTAHFSGQPGLKDVIESIGVPHPEVDLVLVDGRPTPLQAPLHDGARVEVYPAGEGPPGLPRLLPPVPAVPRFVLDGHLGRLASLLRLLGFDTTYAREADDAALAAVSSGEDRVLLTRDLGLLKRSLVQRGAFVRSTQHLAQGREVVDRFRLHTGAQPFTRCLRCNGLLHPTSSTAGVPPRVLERHQRFLRCEGCGQLYWAGTHHDRMKGVVAQLLGQG